MDLYRDYPGIAELKVGARKRLPQFVWEYLDSATGSEATRRRNRDRLDQVLFWPSILDDEIKPSLECSLLGETYPLPFGIAPVAMSGLVAANAERSLASAASTAGLPYCLATLSAQTPERVGTFAGKHAWFQMYPARDVDIRRDMLRRIRESGFETLFLTVDAVVPSRRERQHKSGFTLPLKLDKKQLWQILQRPGWPLDMLRNGLPKFRTLDPYLPDDLNGDSKPQLYGKLKAHLDLDFVNWLREHWQGPLVAKGVMRAEDVAALERAGIDAIWISNHSGRQFDGAPATIDVLPQIRAATELPIICDSGVEGGLDVLRMLALGANFVMLGRAFHYALGALGEAGPSHLIDMLRKDLIANMGQIGAGDVSDLGRCLITQSPA